MMETVLYLHGRGGSPAEAAHYQPLFPASAVVGLDYRGDTPWEVGPELRAAVTALAREGDSVTLIANSIGAYFAMTAGLDVLLRRAYFISPIVDMEGLLLRMLGWAGATEAELRARGTIPTDFGETLSWEYLSYVRAHPIFWRVPTAILCAEGDHLTPAAAFRAFAAAHGAELTTMPGGEHWFHTPEEMAFLDAWLAERV
ncbi:MAG: alpha/beta fold hydrolase [bacterium]